MRLMAALSTEAAIARESGRRANDAISPIKALSSWQPDWSMAWYLGTLNDDAETTRRH